MITLFKLNLIYLILFIKYDELNSKSIVGNQKDSGLYDNASDVSTFSNNKFSNLNSHYKLLSTDGNLEKSIMPAEVIELTTPIASKINFTASTDAEENVVNINDMERLLLNFNGDDGNSCLLDDIKMSLRWWTFPNGTLTLSNLNIMPVMHNVDLSFSNISRDQELYDHVKGLENQQIIVFSAAYNYLTTVPEHTLGFIGNSLKYLTLTGNRFVVQAEAETPDDSKSRINNGTVYNNATENAYHCMLNNESVDIPMVYNKKETIFSKKGNDIAWATFPYLHNLIELDISNCQIEFVTRLVFRNLTNLQRLYISHNKMLTIPFNSFYDIPSLEYLDLSFTNVLDYNDNISLPSLDAVYNLIYGVNIEPLTFENLRKLVYLDLSHTKLTRNSALAFIHLGDQLKYLSLCYTAFPMLGNAIFKNTALRGIDLSGNSFAAYNILEDAFEGVSNTLKFMYFENSNLKDLAWLKHLKNVSFLGLAGNNINSLSVDIFSSMRNLKVLDLSSNQVGNWYKRVFVNNENLRVLSLRDNNLNIITNEMLKDFSILNYLSLGDNDFVCDCLLREIRDVAQINNNEAKCTRNINEEIIKNIRVTMENKTKSIWNNQLGQIDVSSVLWKQLFKKLKLNLKRKKLKISLKKLKMRFLPNYSEQCLTSEPSLSTKTIGKLNGTVFKFQLLDYEEDHYWCFNETEKLNFFQLNCQPQSVVEDIAQQLKTLSTYILVCVGSLIGIALIGFLVYWKRWYIHYYYTTFKTASLMSEAAKDYHNKFNTLSNKDPNMVYDIFISYCQADRDWILEELIPNVEETEDISICLHERDFQIGVTIIDNIVSCMERSRALMLVISSDFLLSHWCQFEMQLAQHRIFDISKEHLILVFLEDIPRIKRPKHLQYLMDIKTYIKWPGGKSKKGARIEDRKLFWKRLKRCLSTISFSSAESKA